MSAPAVHFMRNNKRSTACGRRAKRTARDTKQPPRVTCKTCLRVMRTWRRNCAELQA